MPAEPARDVRVRKHVSGQFVVFGMDWSPLVGGEPERLGLQRAHALGATHYVLSGAHSTVVGAVRLDRTASQHKESLHSAAAIFSRKFAVGAIAYLLPDSDGSYWMIACHAGSVLSHTDRWYESEPAALVALEQIRSRFPTLQVQIEPPVAGQSLPLWLSETLCSQSRLQSVKSFRHLVRGPINVLACLMIAASIAYGVLSEDKTALQLEAQDTRSLWRETLLERSRQHTVHAYPHLNALTQTWQHIPLRPVGWSLRKIQCESVHFDWHCAAHFSRQHRWALNQHLERFKPEGWTMQFTPLDEAAFVWRVGQAASTLDLSEHWMRYDWMSYLQNIGAVFEHIQVGGSSRISIQAPVDGQGHALPIPADVPDWKQRTLVLKGPLRSLPALNALHMPVRWRHANLEVDRAHGLGTTRSALSLELVGDMFESRSE
jgi:hypothetical protein